MDITMTNRIRVCVALSALLTMFVGVSAQAQAPADGSEYAV